MLPDTICYILSTTQQSEETISAGNTTTGNIDAEEMAMMTEELETNLRRACTMMPLQLMGMLLDPREAGTCS